MKPGQVHRARPLLKSTSTMYTLPLSPRTAARTRPSPWTLRYSIEFLLTSLAAALAIPRDGKA